MWGYNGYLKNARFRTEEEGLQDARYLDPNGTTGLTIVREEYDPKKGHYILGAELAIAAHKIERRYFKW